MVILEHDVKLEAVLLVLEAILITALKLLCFSIINLSIASTNLKDCKKKTRSGADNRIRVQSHIEKVKSFTPSSVCNFQYHKILPQPYCNRSPM